MAKARIESSYSLAALDRAMDEVRQSLADGNAALNAAFDTVRDRWQDKNAADCESALREHNAAMRAALARLGRTQSAISRLAELARLYEDI